MSLRDPSAGFDCTETPFHPPKAVSRTDVPSCSSCSLLLSATHAGPKTLGNRSNFDGGGDGMTIDESPLAALTFSNNKYALYDTVLWKNGAHRDFKTDKNYDLEMNLYFRDTYDPNKIMAVAIPIMINDAKAKPYFTELANQNANMRTHTLETLVDTGAAALTYKGIDMRQRREGTTYNAPQCRNAASNMTWFVLGETYISAADANRLRSMAFPSNVNPPQPTHELTIERTRQMTMLVAKVAISGTPGQTESFSNNRSENMYLTRALQCQRIDPNLDVKNDAVYLDRKRATRSLQEELDAAATLDKPLFDVSTNTGVRPKQVEDILALTIGIVMGVVLFGFIAYYLLQYIYKGYVNTIAKQDSIREAILQAKEAAEAAAAARVTG
jgi:hypothetical protein